MTDETKRAILEATLALAGEGGFESLTVRSIAERAGIGIGTVHYHFGSKDKAIAEAYRFVTAELRASFDILRGDIESAETRLRAFARRFAESVHAHGAALVFFTGRDKRAIDVPPEYRDFAMGEGLDLVWRSMREIDSRIDERTAAIRLSIFAGGLLYPELVEGAMGIGMDDPVSRAEYARLAADCLIPVPEQIVTEAGAHETAQEKHPRRDS